MSKSGAFVLPEGLRLTMESGALAIHHEGDVVIEVNPGQELRSVTSTAGDITLTVPEPLELASISAPEGNVTLGGRLTVDSVVAKNIAFVTGRLKATVLKGSESVMLGGSRVEATVVVAPNVSIAGSVKGRATAISANNDLGPHQLKGGFSLAEFVDLVPNGSDVLDAHGIEVPDEDEEEEDDAFEEEVVEEPAEEESAEAEPDEEPDEDEDAGDDEVAAADDDGDDDSAEDEADAEDDSGATDENEPAPADDDELDDGDTVESGEPPVAEEPSGDTGPLVAEASPEIGDEDETAIEELPEVTDLESLEDLDALAEGEVPPTQDDSGVLSIADLPPDASEIIDDDPSAIMVAVEEEDEEASIPPEWEAARATIADALEEIRAAYSGGDIPQPIDTLGALVHDGALSDLKGNINGIWSGLLKHHQRTKAYIPNTVTHMFQQIQMELRKI